MTPPQDRIQLLKSESDRAKDYLSALSTDDWSSPTACEAWEVRDVVAHMIMAAEMFVGNISRGLANDSSPSEGMPPAGSVDVAARQVANAQRAISIRESLGEQLLTAFNASCDDLDRSLAGIGPEDWDKPCFHPAATIPVRTYVDLRLAELIVHGWDIRSRLEVSTHLPEGCLPATVDVISDFIVGILFNPGSKLETPVRYRFELTGPVQSRHDIVVGGGKALCTQYLPPGQNPHHQGPHARIVSSALTKAPIFGSIDVPRPFFGRIDCDNHSVYRPLSH